MHKSNYIRFFLAISILINYCFAYFNVETIESCPGSNNKIYFNDHGHGEDGFQYFDFNFTLSQPFDNNILVEHTIYKYERKKWMKLFTAPQKVGTCAAAYIFGDIRHEIKTLDGKSIASCPISGNYAVKNYKFNPAKLQVTLPKGKLKFINNFINKKTGNTVECLIIVLTN